MVDLDIGGRNTVTQVDASKETALGASRLPRALIRGR